MNSINTINNLVSGVPVTPQNDLNIINHFMANVMQSPIQQQQNINNNEIDSEDDQPIVPVLSGGNEDVPFGGFLRPLQRNIANREAIQFNIERLLELYPKIDSPEASEDSNSKE